MGIRIPKPSQLFKAPSMSDIMQGPTVGNALRAAGVPEGALDSVTGKRFSVGATDLKVDPSISLKSYKTKQAAPGIAIVGSNVSSGGALGMKTEDELGQEKTREAGRIAGEEQSAIAADLASQRAQQSAAAGTMRSFAGPMLSFEEDEESRSMRIGKSRGAARKTLLGA